MKRFLASLLVSLSLAIGLVTPTVNAAATYWTLEMYKPASSTVHSLNIEWKAFSTEETDTFTISLYQNNVKIAEAGPTTKPNGDSGIFAVTLADGTYTYHVQATNNGDASSKTTPDQTVTVSTAENVTIVQQVSTAGTTTGGAVAAAQAAAATPAPTGEVQGAATTTPNTSNGEVNATGNSNTSKNNGKVLGVETKNDSNNNGWYYAIGAAAVVLLAGYYWWFNSRKKNA